MDRQEFLRRADECLQRVVKWLEPFDPDEVDYTESDGVVTLEFADRVRFVLNRQTATNQMWLAAGARAWHYDWDAATQTWVDEKDGHELYANIASVVSSKIGRTVAI
ncbi:MAG: iron donor protein CyaY [Planctomycetota bacterium]